MTTDVPNRWQHLEGTRGYLRRHVRKRIASLESERADFGEEILYNGANTLARVCVRARFLLKERIVYAHCIRSGNFSRIKLRHIAE